jgi:hypothetical protein
MHQESVYVNKVSKENYVMTLIAQAIALVLQLVPEQPVVKSVKQAIHVYAAMASQVQVVQLPCVVQLISAYLATDTVRVTKRRMLVSARKDGWVNSAIHS